MADQKISELTEDTSIALTDLLATVEDPSGTPVTKKTTIQTLANLIRVVKLLKANSGTSTNASAENVDTIALSGLTVKDTLMVIVNMGSATQQTASPQLYHSTDGVVITDSHTIAAGNRTMFTATIQPDPTDANDILSIEQGAWNDDFTLNAITTSAYSNKSDVTTAWTGSWTLALRHGGVTSGGTFRWSWAVYKLSGQ